ncbi:porin [Paraburkholderia domus]|uniref:porin n=1 Tax=Paraburkholderia domus TaxID=2793075 RepID=UPI0019116095|nr:porin [Paraburkholderia domus]MBK5185567.1 porin [Burkholderia sp. R-69749]CAE6881389.1 Outer membrane porin protein [Paraburkholderia domus]
MKAHHLAWIAGTLACTAHAQNSITLYGVIDAGLTYTNSSQTAVTGKRPVGGSQFALSDGSATGAGGSRWGIRGVEDLGNGLAALFTLENAFTINNGAFGTGGAEFGRQAFVGLSGTFGSLTLGRQYDTYTDFVQPLTATGQWAGYMGAEPDDVDSLSNTSRINNAIKFRTPTYRGMAAGLLYSLGGVAGSLTQNQLFSIGAGYSQGPLSVAVGYLSARDPNVSLYGTTPNKGSTALNSIGSFGSPTSAESSPVDAGYASAKTTQIAGAGIDYAFNPVTVGFVVTNTRFYNLGSTSGPDPLGYTGTASFLNFELSVKSQITPALLLGSAFHYTDRNSVDGDGGAKYLQLDLGAFYSLSKRTSLYILTVLQRAIGRDSLGQPAVASITGFSPSTTDRQLGVRIALQQRF